MAETKKNELSQILNFSREAFLNTMETLGEMQKGMETIVSKILNKGTSIQDTGGKLSRSWIDTAQNIVEDFAKASKQMIEQITGFYDKLGDYPYKDKIDKVFKRFTEEIKNTLDMTKVYPMK
jgi:hypothetical protein